MSGGAGKNASEGGIPPELETRVAASETRITKAIFPFNTNHHDTLFGGDALSWMDETAFIAATRFARKSLVTVSTDRIDFRAAIPGGSLVEFVARVSHVGRTSVRVQVDAWLESMYREGREHAISGCFTMVAVDADKRPIPVL
ncbi:MAG: acyl-CoA thioesterase [Halomonadaceae bacterium]|nr:MAG: acyl-CoA thioesterase [Halomonadaceae bacterium]